MNNSMKRSNGNPGTPGTLAPFYGLDGVLNRLFDDSNWGFTGLSQHRSIPVNIRETDNSYEVELVAPGLRKEDFRISLDDKTLTVAFEHKEDARKEEERGYLRQEYRVHSFSRSFHIDESLIDGTRISARYENGVLWLSLPKKEGAQRQRRQIEIM